MFTVYIIQNEKGKRYIGQTRDLTDRLSMHNSIDLCKAKFHRTTFNKGPWQVIFKKEFETRKEAVTFEKFLKGGSGRTWLDLPAGR